jgi:hypothetical protein
MDYLRTERAREIVDHIDPVGADGHFYCHKTTSGGEGEASKSEKSICAGSVLIQMKEERPGQVVRTALRLRLIEEDRLSGWDEVVEDKDAFVEQHGSEFA